MHITHHNDCVYEGRWKHIARMSREGLLVVSWAAKGAVTWLGQGWVVIKSVIESEECTEAILVSWCFGCMKNSKKKICACVKTTAQ